MLVAKRKLIDLSMKLLLILSLVTPFVMLYLLEPLTFEKTWQGRTFYLFFIWLVFLEIIMGWEKLQTTKLARLASVRTVLFAASLLLPLIYVVAMNHYGLNETLIEIAQFSGIQGHWAELIPLSTEYIVFVGLFSLIVFLAYGVSGLSDFSTAVLFLGVIGVLYTIDNLYPFGRFTPFQMMVPTTATLAMNLLNSMGYTTVMWQMTDATHGTLPGLTVYTQGGNAGFAIAWACSGIESLLIYSVVMLIFMKKSDIPLALRFVLFVFGAVVTYLLNIWRVATILLIAANNGNWQTFHDYYGLLYSVTWITMYPLIIIAVRELWRMLSRPKTSKMDSTLLPKVNVPKQNSKSGV